MQDYVLKHKPEPASNEMVWAFDLGKGSIGSPGGVAPVDEFLRVAGITPRGEAVRRGNEFLHKASLLIPAEFALPRGRECCACLRRPRSRVLPRGETKTAASRRRMWRMRQAHKYMNQLRESQTLTALRDALLPRLLSGELRVPAVAKLVEAMA
jgi:hypothetical protein